MTTTRADVDIREPTGTPAGAWTQLWQRLRRKRLAMIGLTVIVIIYALGIGANQFAPTASPSRTCCAASRARRRTTGSAPTASGATC